MLRKADLLDNKTLIFFTSDHGNMEGEHGEKGHGQREGSWWNEKILLPSFVCMPGAEQQIQNYHPVVAFSSHVDYVPTFMDYLDLHPPVDPRSYSNGISLLIKKTEADHSGDRSVALTARYFPEKNKINAVATPEYKFWFRVVAFNHHTQEMTFVPHKVTDWKDVALCLPHDLRAEWARVREMKERDQDQEQPAAADGDSPEDPCQMGLFYELAAEYQRTFFKFLQVDTSVYG